ncbi:MAG: proteasome subunit beta [Nanoarchaeota archaeon]|nr:proteasome subunit beta [Nanoarchaeota archaeon]MBU4116233.1 proteasome subunit beta [Nanoarchaeota archaeon]
MDDELKNSILKTGTTILGIVCKDGVVMAADRQVTAGTIVMNKNFPKVNKINEYLVVSWTGGVADALRTSKLIAAELKLKELKSKSRPTIKQAANLTATITYSQIRQPSMIPSIVGTLIAGFNEDSSAELYTIEPSGSVYQVEDYDANFGSGMPYVLGLLERQYKKDMTIKEGVELAKEALKSSIQRDVGSGYGIDVFTITKQGIKKVVDQEIISEYRDKKE